MIRHVVDDLYQIGQEVSGEYGNEAVNVLVLRNDPQPILIDCGSHLHSAPMMQELSDVLEGRTRTMHKCGSQATTRVKTFAVGSDNTLDIKVTPIANAICERFIGSLKRECLDSCLILHRYQVRQIVNAYVAYYNQARPHQGTA